MYEASAPRMETFARASIPSRAPAASTVLRPSKAGSPGREAAKLIAPSGQALSHLRHLMHAVASNPFSFDMAPVGMPSGTSYILCICR